MILEEIISALFVIAKTSICGKMKKGNTCTVDHYSALKQKEMLPFGTTWMCMLSENKQGTERQIMHDATSTKNLSHSHRSIEKNGACQGLEGGSKVKLLFSGYKVSIMQDEYVQETYCIA